MCCAAAVAVTFPGEGSAQTPEEKAKQRLKTLRETLPVVVTLDAAQFTLDTVARAAAPYLWPTHAERFPPEALPPKPDDTPAATAAGSAGHTYYYAVREFTVPPGSETPEPCSRRPPARLSTILCLEQRLPTTVTGIKIRYFFYFADETGAGRHENDLESAEFYLLTAADGDNVSVFLWKTFGAAHGLPWSTNAANLVNALSGQAKRGNGTPFACKEAEPCYYRPVLFVEEGKHATALDLNRDGHLTPLIDLNKSFREAWGIRDVLSADSRVPPKFGADDFVPRVATSIWSPEGAAVTSKSRMIAVTPALTSPACTDTRYFAAVARVQRADAKPLSQLAKNKNFCDDAIKVNTGEERTPGDRGSGWKEFRWAGPETPYGDNVSNAVHVAFRYDRGPGVSIVFPAAVSLPFMGGWIAPKINLSRNGKFGRGVEVMFVSSSTRKFGAYTTVGWSKEIEAGVKFRTVPLRDWRFINRFEKAIGWVLPTARLGYRARLGARGTATEHRFVFETGIGAW